MAFELKRQNRKSRFAAYKKICFMSIQIEFCLKVFIIKM